MAPRETIHSIWCDTSLLGSPGAVCPSVLTAENPSEKTHILNSTFIKAALAHTSL